MDVLTEKIIQKRLDSLSKKFHCSVGCPVWNLDNSGDNLKIILFDDFHPNLWRIVAEGDQIENYLYNMENNMKIDDHYQIVRKK